MNDLAYEFSMSLLFGLFQNPLMHLTSKMETTFAFCHRQPKNFRTTVISGQTGQLKKLEGSSLILALSSVGGRCPVTKSVSIFGLVKVLPLAAKKTTRATAFRGTNIYNNVSYRKKKTILTIATTFDGINLKLSSELFSFKMQLWTIYSHYI